MSTDRVELSPCPFCGGRAKMHAYRTSEDSEGAHVECTSCGAKTEATEDAYADTPTAAMIWNTRATPAGDGALRKALVTTQEYILRAMAENYADGNLWDRLDTEACNKAADEIRLLRKSIVALTAGPSPSEAPPAPAIDREAIAEAFKVIAKEAAERASKNASVVPELLFAPILWTLQESQLLQRFERLDREAFAWRMTAKVLSVDDTQVDSALADELESLCCAETESKFFDCVTDNIHAILKALRSTPTDALLPAQSAEPVAAVKPLAWNDHNHADVYAIEDCAGQGPRKYFLARASSVIGWFEDIDSAKAHAHEDYEKRIRSALIAAPQPAPGWDEAIEACADVQPSTAENPNENAYQRGRFDGVMEYAKNIRALKHLEPEPAQDRWALRRDVIEALPLVTWWDGKRGHPAYLVESLESYAKVRPGANRDKWAMRAAAKWIRAVLAISTAHAQATPAPKGGA